MTRKRQIAIADDDPKDLELAEASLAQLALPNEVITLRDGVQVLDYLYHRGPYEGDRGPLPAVLLLDIKMPRLDGVQVLRQIKSDESLKSIPVVMWTSSREAADLRACYDLGANAYVVKPLVFAEFMTAIKQLGAFWLSVNELPP